MTYKIQVTYSDYETSIIRITEAQKDDIVKLISSWFDNGLITEWRFI